MKTQKAFTLVELMVTIAVFVILATLTAPSFSSFFQANAMATNTNDLLRTFHLARSEAITRGTRVSVCPSNDGATCGQNLNWESGWIIWDDLDNDNVIDAADPAVPDSTGETIIKIHEGAAGSSVTMRGDANVVSFVPSGVPQNAGDIRICDGRGNNNGAARAVRILASGRIRSTNSANIIGNCP